MTPTGAVAPAMDKLPDCSVVADDTDRYKLQFELYKLRIEEYHNRYESMRALEWRLLFQVYAGYAAIAFAFKYLNASGEFPNSKLVAWLAIFATLIFYLASRYLTYRIQERLIKFDETRERYMAESGSALHVHEPRPGTDSLGHKYYWTYHIQLILSTLTLAGLLAYEAAKGSLMGLWAGFVLITSLAVMFLIVGWVVPKKPT